MTEPFKFLFNKHKDYMSVYMEGYWLDNFLRLINGHNWSGIITWRQCVLSYVNPTILILDCVGFLNKLGNITNPRDITVDEINQIYSAASRKGLVKRVSDRIYEIESILERVN